MARVKLIISAFTLLFVVNSFCQQPSERDQITTILRKTQKLYEDKKTFQFKVNYSLYPTAKSMVVAENYQGLVVKSQDNIYAKIQGTEFIKINSLYVKIDSEAKLMQVTEEKNPSEEMTTQLYKLTQMLTYFNDFALKSTDDYWICTMTAPKLSLIPYGKAVIFINKKDFSITKEVMYMLTQAKYKNNGKTTLEYPRLEITFSPPASEIGKF
jgi:hypothetical protein